MLSSLKYIFNIILELQSSSFCLQKIQTKNSRLIEAISSIRFLVLEKTLVSV